MAFPSLTEQFDYLYSTTLQNMGNMVEDLQYKKTPWLYWLETTQRHTVQGGRWIGRQVRLRKNTAAGSFGRGATFDQVDLNAVTTAKYDWKNVGIPLTRYWDDEQQNSGKFEMINIVKENIDNTTRALREEVQKELVAASPGATDLYSLPYFVSETGSTGTVAGINRANETDWRNQYKDVDTGTTSDSTISPTTELGSFYSVGLTIMRNMAIVANQWGSIDYIIAGATAYSLYDDVALEQKRINDRRMGDAEFMNIGWMGIPLVLDTYLTADNMYMLDSSSWEWVTAPGAYMTWTNWKEIPDSLDRVAQCVTRAQLVLTDPKAQVVLFDCAK